MNLNDLLNSAKAEGIDVKDVQRTGEAFKPIEGETYQVTAVLARSQVTRKGSENIGIHLEVVEGPDGIGRKFWHNLYFTGNMSDDHKKRNALIADLLGVVDLSEVEFGEKPKDLTIAPKRVEMHAKYRNDFPDHTFLPMEDEGYVVEDEDLSWDD